jgi:hypothetical protein
MLAPRQVLQPLLQRRLQWLGMFEIDPLEVAIEMQIVQVGDANLVAGLARRVGIGLHQGARQRVFGRVTVEDEDAFHGEGSYKIDRSQIYR